MTEIWKDVAEYEGLYQASNMGRVKRAGGGGHGTWPGRMLKPWPGRKGYLRVTLCRDGERKQMLVHRLVAEAFLEKPSPDHKEINHKNGDKADNCIENLEWVTRSENNLHACRILGVGRAKGEANARSKVTRRDVLKIRKLAATGDHTQREIGEMFGLAPNSISLIVNRRRWQHVS